ncbi:hypothetical protein [Legionella gratiana]|uniref:hypothetical protein n=1 Tax=Legionella gratiana TaxID=45066 RepID=UPI000731AF9D|nr:hypothetical protein [Legionella gratiana]
MKNQLNTKSRPNDEILIDGELIYSYSPTKDIIFANAYDSLQENLKKAFIADMVEPQEGNGSLISRWEEVI